MRIPCGEVCRRPICSQNFESSISNAIILDQLQEVQSQVHSWGYANRVTFDASKEFFCISHKTDCEGDSFKYLGVLIDPKLIMEKEVQRIRSKAGPKIKAILGTRGYYNLSALVQ